MQLFKSKLNSRMVYLAILRWFPFAGLLCWAGYTGLSGGLSLGMGALLLVGGLWIGWLIGIRIWSLALVTALALSPLAWNQVVLLPRQTEMINRLVPGTYVRIAGTVRTQNIEYEAGEEQIVFLLGEVKFRGASRNLEILEIETAYPAPSRKPRFLYRRRVRIGGALLGVESNEGRIRVSLSGVEYHRETLPINPWGSEVLRTALKHRAGYYLSLPALATYLPIVLGVRDRSSPEAREVVGSFRRVGISHLFAISGLHIGLLFMIFLTVSHFLTGFFLKGQGWLRGGITAKVVIMILIWAYIALIGFPIPAVRASIMGTMLVLSQLWGTRTPRLYVLWLAGLILVGFTPTAFYDISFQLSFLAYFFLIWALELSQLFRGAPGRPQGLLGRSLSLAGMNLLITLLITLGLWPVIAYYFGNISFLVFLGNLLMVPFLSLLVLPSGLLALMASLVNLGQVPGSWLEQAAFGWLEIVISGWLVLVKGIEKVGDGLVFPLSLDWQNREFFLYYAGLAGLLILIGRMTTRGAAKKK